MRAGRCSASSGFCQCDWRFSAPSLPTCCGGSFILWFFIPQLWPSSMASWHCACSPSVGAANAFIRLWRISSVARRHCRSNSPRRITCDLACLSASCGLKAGRDFISTKCLVLIKIPCMLVVISRENPRCSATRKASRRQASALCWQGVRPLLMGSGGERRRRGGGGCTPLWGWRRLPPPGRTRRCGRGASPPGGRRGREPRAGHGR